MVQRGNEKKKKIRERRCCCGCGGTVEGMDKKRLMRFIAHVHRRYQDKFQIIVYFKAESTPEKRCGEGGKANRQMRDSKNKTMYK